MLSYFIKERGCHSKSRRLSIYTSFACQPEGLAHETTFTPLHDHYAAVGKHLEILCYLVAEQQIDPLCCADNGSTPLHQASQSGDINVVRYLVDELSKFLPLKDIVTSRGKDGAAPIHLAALNGCLDIVKFFITNLNCDPNIALPIEYQGRTTGVGGRITLHGAAQRGHLHVIKYLVEQCNCNPSHLDSERVANIAAHGS